MTTATSERVEVDLLGERRVPSGARYGVHALRAAENFARPQAQLLSQVPELCAAFGMVKLAAIQANMRTGAVSQLIGSVVAEAAGDLISDRVQLRESLIVPLLQGGAGTSANMNVNEVLANRALELMGYEHGEYTHCHPNDHVNRSQSTNDVYPTAMRIALLLRSSELEGAAVELEGELRRAARRHLGLLKLGRTQLQDAIAMQVEDEFEAWADHVASARASLETQREGLLEVNLGGTAIGNGLTASPEYRVLVVPLLAQISGLPLRQAPHPISATTDGTALLGYSAGLRGLAIALAKVANDLRLLSSGPNGGLAELELPPVQGGSSMMPGKVNPVIAEWVNQIAFRMRGRDVAITAALDAGQLQLNAMLPLVTGELLGGQQDLHYALDALRDRCIRGVQVNKQRAAELVRHEIGAITSLAAAEGYAIATDLATRTSGDPVNDGRPTPEDDAPNHQVNIDDRNEAN